jgi:AcrR family transcriptional regulator
VGNNSAVQYHFGSKDGLVRAILLHRLPAILQRRKLLGLRIPPRDLRAAVEAHVLPVLEQAEDESSYYAMFLEQLMRYGIDGHPFAALPATYQASQKAYIERVGRMLPRVPAALRTERINQASTICLHASADRQRARHFGTRTAPFAVHVSELLDGLVGFLLAPTSAETLAALAGARSLPVTRRMVVS